MAEEEKKTAKPIAPPVSNETVLPAPSENDNRPITMADIQRSENWPDTPESQMQRFNVGAALSENQGLKEFSFDGKNYDAKYVREFIDAGIEANPELLKQPFFLDALNESAQSKQLGQCFGKKFENGADCLNVMQKISVSRLAHATAIQYSSPMLDDLETSDANKKSVEMFHDIRDKMQDLAEEPIEHKGKTYDTQLDMSRENQWKYFKVLNEEISSTTDWKTKSVLRSLARDEEPFGYDPRSFSMGSLVSNQKMSSEELGKLTRAHALMQASGNPAIRSWDDTLAIAKPFTQMRTPYRLVPRSHFVPDVGGGTLYLAGKNDFAAELAHAFRNKNNVFGEALQFVGDGLKDLLTLKSAGFTPDAQARNYGDKSKMEYDTHSVVEPQIKRYLDGKTPTIEQMYANIDARRQEKGISYSQTSEAEKITQRGYEQIKKDIQSSQVLIASAKIR